MDAFFERLVVRAATIDELLSDDFETLAGQKAHCDLAAQRLSAWCQSCASGDWSMFSRRLERDSLSLAHVLGRFATLCGSAGMDRGRNLDRGGATKPQQRHRTRRGERPS
jgi:hypothetical protein